MPAGPGDRELPALGAEEDELYRQGVLGLVVEAPRLALLEELGRLELVEDLQRARRGVPELYAAVGVPAGKTVVLPERARINRKFGGPPRPAGSVEGPPPLARVIIEPGLLALGVELLLSAAIDLCPRRTLLIPAGDCGWMLIDLVSGEGKGFKHFRPSIFH